MPPSRASSSSSARARKAASRRRPPSRKGAAKLYGSETPRLFTKPRRPPTRETTAGFEAIEFAEHVLGLALLPWQRWLLLHMLELNTDGTFRFRTVVILVARQNGKTTMAQVISLWRMYVDGVALVIGTAQNLDVAEEAWQATVELAESVPDLAAEIKHVDRTNGKKALRLTTGERYKVAASSRRGGRGLSGDLALLDELREHRNWQSWSAVSKTTLAKKHAQLIGMSNAGDGESVVLHHLRARALEAINAGNLNTSLGLFEWSAPEDADMDDRQAWAMANPSLGYTITEAAIENARETDDEDVFRTEVLCQWVVKTITPTIPPDDWDDDLDADSEIVGDVWFGVDTNPRRTSSAIAGAGRSILEHRTISDGTEVTGPFRHVELVRNDSGTDWLADELERLHQEHGGTVMLDPAASGKLLAELVARGVPVKTVSGRETAQASGAFHDDVTSHRLVHIGQGPLDDAVLIAGTRPLGETWAFTHRGAVGDVTPLIAAALANWGALQDADSDYDVLESVL